MGRTQNENDINVFLAGEYVYLRPPDIEKDVKNGKWFSWFNDKKTTRFLAQGVFPNTIDKQINFVESLKTDSNRVLLCIISKENQKHVGVISLYNIDLINRKADISIVMGERKYPPAASLEAMALMTEYGFDRLNLNKIDSGQCEDLWLWVNALELIGYKIEGYLDSVMIRDGRIYNGVHTGITAERFYKIRKARKGNICGNDIAELLRERNKGNKVDKIRKFFGEIYRDDF